MRRSPFLLLALPVAWIACFSSGSSDSGGGANFDASEDTTFPDAPGEEAGPDVVVTADAPVEAMPPPDGSIHDASNDAPANQDASEAEAGPAAVAITVFGATGLEQGVTIVYEDATGAVVGTPVTTGATGMVSQVLPAGATTITALLGTASSPAPYTVMGVQPGDSIVVPDLSSLALYTSGLAQVPTFPPSPPANTASYVLSSGGCSTSASAPPVSVVLGSGSTPCIGLASFGGGYGAAVPLLLEADDTNGNLLAFAFQKDNSLSAFDAGNGVLSVSLAGDGWMTSSTTQSVVVANQPDGGLVSTAVSESADHILRPLLEQFPIDDAGVQHTQVTTHVGYADTLQAEVSLASSPQWTIASATGAAPPTASGTVTIDATPLGALPQITAVNVDATTPAQPTVTWTLAQGTLASTTGLVATTTWTATDDAGTTTNGRWTIIAPSSATSIHAPALPSSAGAYQPPAGATFQATAVQGLVGTVLPTYAQLRTAGAAIAAPLVMGGCIASPVLPYVSTGTLSVTIYSSGLCG